VIIENSYSAATVTGEFNVGSVTGWVGGGGTIGNSYSTGAVTGNGSVGGVAGKIEGSTNGTIENSHFAGEVSSDLSQAGGVAGSITQGGVVRNSYSKRQDIV